jgi:CRP/FNR family transcriptional regulator, cyclic AMP receptor protein
MANINLLKKLYLFKDLNDKELEIVGGAAAEKKYLPGDEVFSQGERATALYVIQFGSVRIHQRSEKGDGVEVARLSSGAHFGEMPFLDGETRSATATAIEGTTIMALDYDKLGLIMVEHPGIATHFYRQFSIFLCGRLRMTTSDLSFARGQNLSHF